MAVLSKFVKPGDRVDLVPVQQAASADGVKKQYSTKVFDVISDDEIQINMPIEGGRIIVLSVGAVYDLCFYTSQGGLYQCFARVSNRYKSNNIIIASMELTSTLRRFQRREYFRLNCVLDMKCTQVTDEQTEQFKENVEFFDTNIVLDDGVIVDISGGGLRFVSNKKHEQGSQVYFNFKLNIGEDGMVFKTIGRVISCSPAGNNPGQYESRVQFLGLNPDDRETIIKYIFEEERKIRQKGK